MVNNLGKLILILFIYPIDMGMIAKITTLKIFLVTKCLQGINANLAYIGLSYRSYTIVDFSQSTFIII